MNSDMIYATSTIGPEETSSLGARLGHLLRGGEVIELLADLGGGKTTFVKGLVGGMGYVGEVPSPTFTISRIYPVRDNQLDVYHYDFYRLAGVDVITPGLTELMGRRDAIVAIEWPGNIPNVLPEERLKVTLVPGLDEDSRDVTIEALAAGYEYIIEGLSGDSRGDSGN